MALVSMTGFGRSRGQLSDRFGASVVVRSVNHRYLDIQIRTNLREEAPEVEAAVRSVVAEGFERGRVTAQLNLERHSATPVDVAVNTDAVRHVLEQLTRIEMPENTTGSVGLGDVLAVPGLVSVTAAETILEDGEFSALKKVTAEAVDEAVRMRVDEGTRLGRQIESELAELTAFADWFEPRMPDMRQRIFERTKERVEVDQLSQIKSGTKGSLYEQNTYILKELAALKKELRMPVVLLVQISRKIGERKDKKPTLFDLKSTGAIEEDADIVLLIHREYEYSKKKEEEYDGEVEIAKQRSGPKRNINLNWHPKTTTFSEGG